MGTKPIKHLKPSLWLTAVCCAILLTFMAQATASENETPQSAISLVVYHLDADPTLEGGKHIATALTDAIGEMAYHHPDVLWTYLEGMVKFYQPPYPVEAFDPRAQEGLNLLKRWGIAYAVTGQIQGGPQGTLQLSLYQPPEIRPVWQQSYPVTSSGDLEPALQNLLTALFERIGKPLTDSNRRFLARRWYRTSQGQQAYGQGMACHWRENDPEECRKAFMTAIKAEPEVADGYDYLGWSLVREGDWAQAAQVFQQATELQPGFFDALWGLHISLRQQGNFKAAREVLETVQHTHGGQWEVLSYNLMQPGAFADDLADSRQRLRRQAGQSAYWQDRYLDAEIQSLFLAGEWRELIERYQERLALLKSMLGEQHPATLAWAKEVQHLQIAYQGLAQRRQNTTLLEITTPSGKRIQDFILPLAVARDYQPLVAMILQNPSMDDEQRQEMINKLPLLEPAKREKLAQLQQARPRLSWYEQWLQGKTDRLYTSPEIQPVTIEKLKNTGVQIGSLEWLLRSVDLSSQAAQAREAGDYAKAETLARQSLILAEDFGGPEHLPDGENFAEYLAVTLNILGRTLEDQQRYAEAEPAYRRLLAVRNGYLGPEHPDTALGMNGLARLLRKQGKYTEAEELCRHALAIYEKVQGPEHLDTAFGLNNLALVLDDQGRYTEAEGLYRRVLAIIEKEKGSDHPDTATSLNNLARYYRRARPLCRS